MKKYFICVVVMLLTVIISVPALAAGTVKDTKKETIEVKQVKEVKEEKKLSIIAPEDGTSFSEKDIAISLSYKDGDKIRLYITKEGSVEPFIYKENTELTNLGIWADDFKLDSVGKYKIRAELYKGNKLLETRSIEFSITNTNVAMDYIESKTETKILTEPIKDTLIRENIVKDIIIRDTKIDIKK